MEKNVQTFEEILPKKANRKTRAKLFYHILVLASHGFLKLHQITFGKIKIEKGKNFLS